MGRCSVVIPKPTIAGPSDFEWYQTLGYNLRVSLVQLSTRRRVQLTTGYLKSDIMTERQPENVESGAPTALSRFNLCGNLGVFPVVGPRFSFRAKLKYGDVDGIDSVENMVGVSGVELSVYEIRGYPNNITATFFSLACNKPL